MYHIPASFEDSKQGLNVVNVLLVLAVTIILFALAARLYGRLLEKWLGADPGLPTPAHTLRDGRDYVPTRPHILFGHHFASIAGAGPIVGPVVALIYGCGPVWVWIAAGAIFVGATHDFAALFVSVREGGRSMADAARKVLGTPGYVLFILFVLVLIVLVTSSFLAISAISLTSTYPLEKLGLPPDQTLLRTVEKTVEADGATRKVAHGVIGGIASTSAVAVTLAAPLLGYLVYRRGIRTVYAYMIALAVCAASVWAGLRWPIQLAASDWMLAISIYTVFAAGLPVWLVLQPRDFVNVQILYAGVVALVATVVAGGARGMETAAPLANAAEGAERYGPVWPFVFTIVACGAISGFHAMVAG
ncbi:MAG: carbon starvation protein A, partial [Planctomycetota bacterium]|nr:carbon starvation protein A [Planctomycetota bacterium]